MQDEIVPIENNNYGTKIFSSAQDDLGFFFFFSLSFCFACIYMST